jgi:predicted DCC family thiol-disulfide oxidoreductase YuxK
VSAPAPRAALLYDAECGFCRWCVGRVLAWDRHRALRPVPIQGPEGVALLAGLDEAARVGSWHLVGRDGRRTSAGAAVAPLARMLPGGEPLARVADRFPRAVERTYRCMVRRRGTLGRLVTRGAARRARRRIAARAGI